MIDNSKFEMVNSRYAMTTICNVLMNITVLEPQYVNDTPIFFHILKFIMNSLPTLDNNGKLCDYRNDNIKKLKNSTHPLCISISLYFRRSRIVWQFISSWITDITSSFSSTKKHRLWFISICSSNCQVSKYEISQHRNE